MSDLKALIESSDLAGLNRYIDGICARRDWDELVDLRDRCNEAVERGKQLWGTAQFAEYRLALEAPVKVAFDAGVLADGRGRFALGPLWEVAASTHPWADFVDLDLAPTIRTMIGHERSIRGDTVGSDDVDRRVLLPPVGMALWEPDYPVAEYKSDRADFPDPFEDLDLGWLDLPDPAEIEDEDGVCHALMELVKPWWEDSLGKAEAITVDGTIEEGISALGPSRARTEDVDASDAIAAMAWAGSSGGGHGRRRGTPTGRSGAWWVILEALGYDELPDDVAAIGEELDELRWVLWDPGDAIGGWGLHVGIEDPEDSIAWILSAVDAK